MSEPTRLDTFVKALRFEAGSRVARPQALVADVLGDIAGNCEEAGSSLIGHIKCHAGGGVPGFSCSLTSRRLGAARRGAQDRPLEQDGVLDMDLAVLVYGLTWETIDAQVTRALRSSERRHGGRWIERGPGRPEHAHDSC